MGFYISAKTGGYYEGDRVPHSRDLPLREQRPSPDHQWESHGGIDSDGFAVGEWVYVEPPAPEPTEVELLQAEIESLKARLDKAEADIVKVNSTEKV